MSLKEKIDTDYKTAMHAKDTTQVGLVRLVKAEVGRTCDGKFEHASDEQIIQVVKKLKESTLETMRIAGSSEQTAVELKYYDELLPKMVSGATVEAEIASYVSSLDDPSPRDIGGLMKHLKDKFGQAVDMKHASSVAKQALTK